MTLWSATRRLAASLVLVSVALGIVPVPASGGDHAGCEQEQHPGPAWAPAPDSESPCTPAPLCENLGSCLVNHQAAPLAGLTILFAPGHAALSFDAVASARVLRVAPLTPPPIA